MKQSEDVEKQTKGGKKSKKKTVRFEEQKSSVKLPRLKQGPGNDQTEPAARKDRVEPEKSEFSTDMPQLKVENKVVEKRKRPKARSKAEDGGTATAYKMKPVVCLTLKAPNKNCSRRHFNCLRLSFEENKA